MRYNPDTKTHGDLVHRELLGEIRREKEKDEPEKYLDFRTCLQYAKAMQPLDENRDPYDPSEPAFTGFAFDLHASVAQELGLGDYSGLEFYTAINSPLDRFHGVDGFFEYHFGKGVSVLGYP